MTLIVNLFAGPGAGKSTTAALVFAKLKQMHVNTELVTEFAKELTWEERHNALTCQPYVIGKQIWKIERLLGKVDVIVTDSPILLGHIYAPPHTVPEFKDFITAMHNSWSTRNYFLRRGSYKYNTKGRNQTLEEAVKIDEQIKSLLNLLAIPHTEILGGGQGAVTIANHVYRQTTRASNRSLQQAVCS